MSTAAPAIKESSVAATLLGEVVAALESNGYEHLPSLGSAGLMKQGSGFFTVTPGNMEPRGGGQSQGRENMLFVVEINLAEPASQATGFECAQRLLNRLQWVTGFLMFTDKVTVARHREFRGTRFDNEANKLVARLQIGFLIQEIFT